MEYLAYPPQGKGKGILVLSEWWGVVDHIKSVVDRFAKEGFVAYAPDLYHGKTTTKPDEAGRLMMALNIEETAQELSLAASKLLKNPAVTSSQVGVIGFCMGGQLALYAASVSSDIGACVDFYGIHSAVHPKFHQIKCPVLGFFGSRDAFVTPEVVHQLDMALRKDSVEHTFYSYDANHAFFNDSRPEVYNKEAAQDAWAKTVTFVTTRLAHRAGWDK
ncbi:MAG: dienelactone hydrolase family protein [Simkaniaceae bacterium]|nr:dienelactone hydrolase family protein [Simkaniaceae bacterium]